MFKTRLQWKQLPPRCLLAVVALALGGWEPLVGIVLLIPGLLWPLLTLAAIHSSEFALTTRRLTVNTGLWPRISKEMALTVLDGVEVDQGRLGQIGRASCRERVYVLV